MTARSIGSPARLRKKIQLANGLQGHLKTHRPGSSSYPTGWIRFHGMDVPTRQDVVAHCVSRNAYSSGQGPHDRRMILHPHDFRMFRHPHIYRMSRHPQGPRATQPSDDSPSTRFSDVLPSTQRSGVFAMRTGQGPHSSDDEKTFGGFPVILRFCPGFEVGVLGCCVLGRGVRPDRARFMFFWGPDRFFVGRQPENWPFTMFHGRRPEERPHNRQACPVEYLLWCVLNCVRYP